jgi:hypothetical protein
MPGPNVRSWRVARNQSAVDRRVVVHQVAHAECPRHEQGRRGEGHDEGPLEVVAADGAVDVEDEGPMLYLLGRVPAQQGDHHRVGARPVEALVLEHPSAHDAGEMLEGGHDREAAQEPPPPERFRPVLVRSERSQEHGVEPLGVLVGVYALCGEVLEHNGVGSGVPRLLAHEGLDRLLQLLVLDEGRRLPDDLDEPAFAPW